MSAISALTTSVKLPFTIIEGQKVEAIPNDNLKKEDGTPKSALDHLVGHTKTTNGAYQWFRVLERVTKLFFLAMKEMGSAMASFFEDLTGKFGLVGAMLAIPRLPEVTQAAKKAISDWSKPPQGPWTTEKRNQLQKVHDVADAAACWGYVGSLFIANPVIKNMADIPDLVANVTELTMAREDWLLAKKHLQYVNTNDPSKAPVQRRYFDTVKHTLLRLIKGISTVVSGVLGLLALAFGAVISPWFLTSIGLTSTIAAMSAYYFKESIMPYKLIEFHKPRPEVLVSGAPGG